VSEPPQTRETRIGGGERWMGNVVVEEVDLEAVAVGGVVDSVEGV
jgi:hypothetical protein